MNEELREQFIEHCDLVMDFTWLLAEEEDEKNAERLLKEKNQATRDFMKFFEQSLKQTAREAVESVIPEKKDNVVWYQGDKAYCSRTNGYNLAIEDMKKKASNYLGE